MLLQGTDGKLHALYNIGPGSHGLSRALQEYGAFVGDFLDQHQGAQRQGDFILSPGFEPIWQESLRELVVVVRKRRKPAAHVSTFVSHILF